MDATDKKLLNLLQADFPLEARPYAILAQRLGITEKEAIQRTRRLCQQGIIRRLGPIFDSERLGFFSALVAMAVPANKITPVAKLINQYPGVTHNYLRNHTYNIWFTLTAKNRNEFNSIIKEIRAGTAVDELLILPAKRRFKLKVEFEL